MSEWNEVAVRTLVDLFDFERRGANRFRAAATSSPMQRLYGGQVIAQALDAARRTVDEDRPCHSFHAYFVRPGDPRRPIDLAVARDADSRSFSNRRVTARQGGSLILSLVASFQLDVLGPHFQAIMPEVPPPDGLESQDQWVERNGHLLPQWNHAFWLNEQAVEYRFCEPFTAFGQPPASARRNIWMRIKISLSDELFVHQRLLAYASDLHIMHSALLPLGIGWGDENLRTASLDHAVWFHERFRADEWLLYSLDSGFAGHARALGSGHVFASDGRLVATVMQEGLARVVVG